MVSSTQTSWPWMGGGGGGGGGGNGGEERSEEWRREKGNADEKRKMA